jgi:drug/metabolite transporter (DMT)-like permease
VDFRFLEKGASQAIMPEYIGRYRHSSPSNLIESPSNLIGDSVFPIRPLVLTSLAMLAFAGNSILCRIALKETAIDAASFTTIRLVSGALVLWLVVRMRSELPDSPQSAGNGNWLSALALFVYAAAFSFAYLSLSAGTGALLLFGAVQMTMIGAGLRNGEHLGGVQVAGLVVALMGLIILLLPGLSAPPLLGSLLMISAGVAWGAYSLRGHGAGDPTRVTAGNFLRTMPITCALSLLMLANASIDRAGVTYAVVSGAVTSGLGYAIWYSALPMLKATTAATVQLSVPVIAAIGGVLLLSEPLSWRLLIASIAVLGGIAMVVLQKSATRGAA